MHYPLVMLAAGIVAVAVAGVLVALGSLSRRVRRLSRDVDTLWGQSLSTLHAHDQRLMVHRECLEKLEKRVSRLSWGKEHS